MTTHLNDGHSRPACGADGAVTTTPIEVSCAECAGGLAAERCPGCGVPPAFPTRVYVGPLRGDWHGSCYNEATRRTA